MIPERRKFGVGCIDDTKQRVVRNDWIRIREALKYLVKYVLLKQMNNICISYKENTEVIYHVCADTVVDGEDLLSGAEEKDEDQDQHDDASKGGDDDDDENDTKCE